MFIRPEFDADIQARAQAMSRDEALQSIALSFVAASDKYNYAHQQSWLGLPLVQLPEDILVNQQIFWADRPDVVVESGVAWGGSVVFHASLMALAGKGRVLAIDKFIPEHVRIEIMKFPFSERITLIEGDSVSHDVVGRVRREIAKGDKVAAFLDSNHCQSHVLSELRAYAPMVTKGQHLTVYATAIESLPENMHRPRPWGHGNNPLTALRQFLAETNRFIIDPQLATKELVTFAPQGRLLCVK
jgi:cephalosporin hydroxylase